MVGARQCVRVVALVASWVPTVIWSAAAVTANDVTDYSVHWAFRPIQKRQVPSVRNVAWPRQPLDHFVLHRLERSGIEPSTEAEKETLLRRVTLDLTGLLPTAAEIDRFVADSSPASLERAVDRLLNSPHYGERWARAWLDICHFAESDGYLTDQVRPVAWRYRQWVIDTLNRDMPFDQFTIEQLAGDLLPNASVDQRIATGFLRQTLSNREGGADLEEFRVLQVVDRTQLLGTAWLGLTVGCAQCHDHKYDPMTQKEFYSLYAFFDSADEINIDAPLPGELGPYVAAYKKYQRQREELLRPVASEIDALQRRWEEKLLEAFHRPGQDHVWDRQWELLGLTWGGGLGEGQLEGCQIVRRDWEKRTDIERARLLDFFLRHGEVIDTAAFDKLKLNQLGKDLRALRDELPTMTRAPTIAKTEIPRQTHLHLDGDFRSAGDAVTPDTPDWLPPMSQSAPVDRLALAKWLVSREHPLTARVVVNRAWQEFFGRGLVVTPGDFGTQGEAPTHPELLDWLASQLRDRGWSMKWLHRTIVLSATYRQASHSRPELLDPDNRLLARQEALRLSAEQIRDVTLMASHLLDRRVGGPSVFPPQPESVRTEGFDVAWNESEGGDRYRRGLYTFTRRQAPFAQNVTFDGPDPSRSCVRRQRSNTSLQALTLLNDPVFFEAAQAFAQHSYHDGANDFGQRLERIYQIALGRHPNNHEVERLHTYWRHQIKVLEASPGEAKQIASRSRLPERNALYEAAWTGLCSVVLNLHEFITRE